MQNNSDRTADPGRRRFIQQAAAAGLLTAMGARFPTAYGESTGQGGGRVARTILICLLYTSDAADDL